MMVAFLALVLAAASPASAASSDAWTALQAVVESSSQTPAEKVILTYDPSKRLLRVTRELQLNKITLRRNIQEVRVDLLAQVPQLEAGKKNF
jgi:hypothetical protein